MTKEQLIKRISADTSISRETTMVIVESFFDCVKKNVANGEDVTLRGFGTFENVLRREKNFHYAPGKYRVIAEHYEVRVRFSREVKDVVK